MNGKPEYLFFFVLYYYHSKAQTQDNHLRVCSFKCQNIQFT